MVPDVSRLILTDGGLDLRVLARRISRDQLVIWIVTLICTVAMIAYLQNATYKYTISYEVTPVEGTSDSLSSTLGKVGGIAQLAGISMPQGSESTYKLYLEGVQSRDVAEVLSHDRQLMHAVFKDEWDPVGKRWREPHGFSHDTSIALRRFLGVPGPWWHQPDGARLHEVLLSEIYILQTPKGATTTLSIKSDDRAYGIMLLNRLHEASDGLLRERALIRIDDYLRYLTDKLKTVLLSENRIALSQTLGDQERARMLASSPRSFAAEVFQSPTASISPTSPRPLLFLVGAIAAGILVGLMIVLVRIFMKEFALEDQDPSAERMIEP